MVNVAQMRKVKRGSWRATTMKTQEGLSTTDIVNMLEEAGFNVLACMDNGRVTSIQITVVNAKYDDPHTFIFDSDGKLTSIL